MNHSLKNLSKQKKIFAAVGVIVVGGVFCALFMTDSGSVNAEKRKKKKENEVKSLIGEAFEVDSKTAQGPQDRFVDQTSAEVQGLKQENLELKNLVNDVNIELKKIKEGMNKKPEETVEKKKDEQTSGAGNLGAIGNQLKPKKQVELPPKDEMPNSSDISPPRGGKEIEKKEPPKNETIHIPIKKPEKKIDPLDSRNIDNYIPSTSVVSVVLINGVDAPTGGQAQANPMPIAFRIKSLANLPNFATGHIKECRFLGSSTGEISSERAQMRIESISCVLKNKKIIERKARGYVTGEDGKVGMRGRVVSKKGKAMAMAGFAGFIGGLGGNFAQQGNQITQTGAGVVTTVDPKKALVAGGAAGVQGAADQVAERIIKEADEVYDVIEIDAGRLVEVVIQDGIDMGESTNGTMKENLNGSH